MTARIKILVVDDSAFTRKVIREILESEPDLEVVGIARDGLEALEKIAELHPDVVTLDLVMPNLDGVGVLRNLPREHAPSVVVVSMSDAETELGAEALLLGAVDLVAKPTALASAQLYEIATGLRAKVRLAALARPRSVVPAPAVAARPETAHPRPSGPASRDIVVIGTSTGGPQALTRLLTALPADFPTPLAIALHIPAGYTEALARRLDDASEIHVVEASDGLELVPGTAVLARGGEHLTLARVDGRTIARVDRRARPSAYTPSVNALFESAAQTFGSRVLGVVLTGMGDDGLEGSRAIKAAGGHILAESAASSVVYGMPRCVVEAGVASSEHSIDGMPSAILRALHSP